MYIYYATLLLKIDNIYFSLPICMGCMDTYFLLTWYLIIQLCKVDLSILSSLVNIFEITRNEGDLCLKTSRGREMKLFSMEEKKSSKAREQYQVNF